MRAAAVMLLATLALLAAPRPAAAEDPDALRDAVAALEEDVEDVAPALDEFATFDQCMFLVGVSRFGTRSGYHFGPHGGQRRPALAYEWRPLRLPRFQFLAFPGEEPPQIECNEDASGEGTDE